MARGGLRGAGRWLGGCRKVAVYPGKGSAGGLKARASNGGGRGRVPMVGGDAFIGEVGKGFGEGTKIWRRRFAPPLPIGRLRGEATTNKDSSSGSIGRRCRERARRKGAARCGTKQNNSEIRIL